VINLASGIQIRGNIVCPSDICLDDLFINVTSFHYQESPNCGFVHSAVTVLPHVASDIPHFLISSAVHLLVD